MYLRVRGICVCLCVRGVFVPACEGYLCVCERGICVCEGYSCVRGVFVPV